MSYLGVQSWELVLHSALHKILALHLLKTYFTLKDTYTDIISTALREKTNSLVLWRTFNLLERKLTLSRENSNSRSLFKIKKKKKQLHCCRMCTSNAAVTQSGITLFVVLWIHCHVISSVGVKTWILNSRARFTLHISDSSKCAIQKHCGLETFYIRGKIEWWLVKVELVAVRQQISPICLMTFDISPEARVGVHTFVANHCCASFVPLSV